MISALLGASLLAYFVASALYLANLHIKRTSLGAYGTAAAVAGVFCQTVRLALYIHAHSTPFVNVQEAIFFLSWAIVVSYLVVLAKYRLDSVGSLAMPLALLALALVFRFSPSETMMAGTGWLRIHIAAIIISFALFMMAFCSAVFYLVQNKLLKSKHLRGMFRKLPPLSTVDELGFYLSAIGFPLLTLGIITGVVGVEMSQLRAHTSMVKLWTSAAAWVTYGAYLLAHNASGWRGKRANWVLIIGAVLIALTTALHKFV